MSKDIELRVHLRIDGKDQITTLTTDAKGLQKAISESESASVKLRHSLLKLTQLSVSFQGLMSSITQIRDAMQSYTQAYALQEQNEKRLAEVMRERMGATDGMVRSMYALASAQQAQGVVGDEVQLQGMQQLATFLKQEDSLKKLVPAMNNLLVQQRGLNATGEDAQNIGNLLGKAMQGQVMALRRVGISFDEAQAKIMETGTEEERAAMLAEIVTQNVGQMNAEMAKTSAGRLKQQANAMGDMAEQVGKALMPYQALINEISHVGLAVMGLGGMLSSLSAVVRVALYPVGLLATRLNLAGKAAAVCRMALANMRNMVRAVGLTMKGAAVSTEMMKSAIRGLMTATAVGAALAALGIVVEKLIGKLTESKESLKGNNDELAENRAQLMQNIARLKTFNGTKAQENSLVSEMNDRYGDTMGYYSSVADWYKTLTANSAAYCRQMEIEARLRDLANQGAEAQKAAYDILYDENGKRKVYSSKRERTRAQYNRYGAIINSDEAGKAKPSDLDKANAAYRAAVARQRATEQAMQRLMGELNSIVMPAHGADKPPVVPAAAATATATGGSLGEAEEVRVMNWQEMKPVAAISPAGGGVKGAVDAIGARGNALEAQYGRYQELESLAGSYKGMMDAGIIGADEYLLKIGEINAELRKMGAVEVKPEVDSKPMGKMSEKTRNAYEAVGQLGQGFSQLGSAIELPELNAAGVLAQAIATMAMSFAEAMKMAAETGGPWGWIAFGATGLAQLATTISTVKSIGKYAEGGIAYGPTLGLFGEYAGAGRNPEVVAPLDKLRGLLGADGGAAGGKLELRVRGRDLVAALANETRVSRRATGIRV